MRWGILLPVSACAIDSGYESQAVYEFCRTRYHRRIFAVKGRGGPLPVWQRKPTAKNIRGEKPWTVGTDTAKETISGRLKNPTPSTPGYSHFPVDREEGYFEQLLGEVLVTTYSRGQPKREWRPKPGVRQEALDARVYAYAALRALMSMGLRLDAEAERIEALRPEPGSNAKSAHCGKSAAGTPGASKQLAGIGSKTVLITPVLAERIEHWPVERLAPYERNPRTHSDAQVAQIAASIVEFGFVNPILVDSNAGIVAGHGRLLAAKKLGLAEVPVVMLDHLSETQKRAYIIADNRLAENAGWDEQLLAEELAATGARWLRPRRWSASMTMNSEALLADRGRRQEEHLDEEEEIPEAPASRGHQPGDIWLDRSAPVDLRRLPRPGCGPEAPGRRRRRTW